MGELRRWIYLWSTELQQAARKCNAHACQACIRSSSTGIVPSQVWGSLLHRLSCLVAHVEDACGPEHSACTPPEHVQSKVVLTDALLALLAAGYAIMGVFVIIGIVLTTTIFRAIGECIPNQQGLLCSCCPPCTEAPLYSPLVAPNRTSPWFRLSHRLSMKSALQSAAPYCTQTPHLLPS